LIIVLQLNVDIGIPVKMTDLILDGDGYVEKIAAAALVDEAWLGHAASRR
jgi:hypothetical protein